MQIKKSANNEDRLYNEFNTLVGEFTPPQQQQQQQHFCHQLLFLEKKMKNIETSQKSIISEL